MGSRILITGSEGLIGFALRSALQAQGATVVGLDLKGARGEEGDVRDTKCVRMAIAECDGVVHLAAVSRVVWGECDPKGCWETNVDGLTNVVEAALAQSRRPWFVFASSREVYGQPDTLLATEETPLAPVNVYGRSKVEGEHIVQAAQRRGLDTAIVRLSNVYGSKHDHVDRVVPAFARAAMLGGVLRVDGSEHAFDFTHIDDTVRGLLALIDILSTRQSALPPINLVTGRPTSLGTLAACAVELAGRQAQIMEAPARSFDVSNFHGNPARAFELLDWTPRVGIREGLERLIHDLRTEFESPG